MGLEKEHKHLAQMKKLSNTNFFGKELINLINKFGLKFGGSAGNRTYNTSNPWRKWNENVLFCSLR